MAITVGELIAHLSIFNADDEVTFGNDDKLTFYRTKKRGENLVNIEFAETILETDSFQD